jgi:hypothetical protein
LLAGRLDSSHLDSSHLESKEGTPA